jgi:hypothetical protein
VFDQRTGHWNLRLERGLGRELLERVLQIEVNGADRRGIPATIGHSRRLNGLIDRRRTLSAIVARSIGQIFG